VLPVIVGLRRLASAAGMLAVTGLLAACSGGSTAGGGAGGGSSKTGDASGPMGKASLKFDLTPGARSNPALVDPPKGFAYGRLYFSEDVGLTGPHDGATLGPSIEIQIDLTGGGPSANAWVSGPMTPQRYTFLGFFDVNGDGATTRNPATGDPATLPTTNQFDVKANQTTEATILFDLVFN